MQNLKIVDKSIANVYKSNTFTSEIVTQALFWEKIVIIEVKGLWNFVVLNDGYSGWIHDFYLTSINVLDSNKIFDKNDYKWYWVIDSFADTYNKNFKISFGSKVPCLIFENNLHMIHPNGLLIKISKKSLMDSNKPFEMNQILKNISKLNGIPYLWGGKSSFGYDCSGLIQIISFMSNHNLPRDCSMQIKSNKLVSVKSSDISKGDLVYFSLTENVDHVGIFLNEIDFIHSSGCVKINSTSKESNIYNSKLCDNIYNYYRFKQQ